MESFAGQELFRGLFREEFEIELNEFKKQAAEREKELELQAREKEKELELQAAEREQQIEKEHIFKMFSKRFGESLTEKEKKLIVLHLDLSGADKLYDAVLKHDNKDDLRNWLKYFE